jgi:TonB family protein
MEPVLKCIVVIAGAGVFGLPLDFSDRPPEQLPPMNRYEPPAFPASLRLTSIADGYAKMLLTVDESGDVDDAVAIEASHPAFVDAVREALDAWRFKPAASATVPRRELIQFEFKRTGMISNVNQREASKSFFPEVVTGDGAPIRTVAWDDLDVLPGRLAATAPVYPKAFRQRPIKGYALVSFVIDAAGRVRVVAVTGASDPEFGRAALEAVRTWRFEAPRDKGGPVHVTAERSFTFGSKLSR